MDAIKPDQERVKNLLLDTVTLLCKNSLQFENYLRVEGLLGVAVDDKDTFFLHISERFQSDAYIERQKQEQEEKEAEARREREEKEEAERAAERASEEAETASRNASEALAIRVKTEAKEQEDDDDDDLVITGSSSLNSPQTVARSATMVAGQRRAQRRTHSPSSSSVHNQSDSANYHQTQQSSPYVQSDSEDGDGSYSQYDNNQSIKTEHWDGPPNKRQAMSNPWPNVSLGDLSMQAAQATFSDSGDGSFAGGGGDPSEPGCSAWPTNLQLQQSGSQDSMTHDDSTLGGSSAWPTAQSMHLPGKNAATDRPYVCYTCGKGFKRGTHLRQHVRTHTGERPYRCEICGADFSDSSNCRKHIRKHDMAQGSMTDMSPVSPERPPGELNDPNTQRSKRLINSWRESPSEGAVWQQPQAQSTEISPPSPTGSSDLGP